MFFFFKQKAAYEMLIRDWSSDVCSSDLAVGRVHDGHPGPDGGGPGEGPADGRVPVHHLRRGAQAEAAQGAVGLDVPGPDRAAVPGDHVDRAAGGAEDRKSVVEGQSVSVRVDLGGRRDIKKKKNQT